MLEAGIRLRLGAFYLYNHFYFLIVSNKPGCPAALLWESIHDFLSRFICQKPYTHDFFWCQVHRVPDLRTEGVIPVWKEWA